MFRLKKRKKKHKGNFFLIAFSLCFIVALVYLFSTYFFSIYNIYTEKKVLSDKIVVLAEEEEALKKEVEKLKDPEYVARYAREKYYYSKNGEFIIKLP